MGRDTRDTVWVVGQLGPDRCWVHPLVLWSLQDALAVLAVVRSAGVEASAWRCDRVFV